MGEYMKIFAEISVGELIDKITILEIKLVHIVDEGKRRNVARELEALAKACPPEAATSETARLRSELKLVNGELWRIEDNIRAHERAQTFDAEFIALARSVYKINDSRAALKREINILTESDLVEEKSYQSY
jgi:hypothetical protein